MNEINTGYPISINIKLRKNNEIIIYKG